MTATTLILVILAAIFVGALVIRWANKRADYFDYCDTCASEPMPLDHPATREHVRAHQPWGSVDQ